jgi:hypothetical protein
MKNFVAFIVSALLLGTFCPATAQEDDFMIWSGYSLSKNFNPSWSARVRQEVRLRENATQVQKAFTDVGVRYKMNKNIRFALHYRYNHNVRRDFTFSSRHRINADLILRHKWNPLVVNYRLRYQQNYRDIFSSETGFFPRHFIRHKIQPHLDLNKKWSPYIYAEWFHTPYINDFAIIQSRYGAGTTFEINRNNNITIYYLLRTTRNVNNPRNDYILGFRLNVFI